jgi:hypothetical protein
MTPEPKSKYTYLSGTTKALGASWDVLQVLYYHEDSGVRSANNFTIARDASGMIMRKTDSDPEQWEVITDPDDLRVFQHCFDERNKLAAAE